MLGGLSKADARERPSAVPVGNLTDRTEGLNGTESKEPAYPTKEAPRSLRVLLVEDHGPLTRALRRGLEEEGYAVDVAPDCGAADARAQTTAYNAIILDLTRHRGSGTPLLGGWRQAGRTIPMLVLTAPDNRLRGSDCLSVPFQLEELLARLKELVHPTPDAKPAME